MQERIMCGPYIMRLLFSITIIPNYSVKDGGEY